jgi:hypothetical protein
VVKGVLLLAGVLLASVALKPLDDFADVEVVGPKLARFRVDKDEISVLFVGSSYVFREVSPEVFDDAAAARNMEARSFNLGVPGMDPPETYFLLETALAERPANLRWVIIELDHYRTGIRPRNVHTRRFEYWHTPARTLEVSRAILAKRATAGLKAKELATHAEVFARWLVNAGWGRHYVDGLIGGAATAADARLALGPRGDGYMSLDDEEATTYGLRREFFQALEVDRLEEKRAALVEALRGGPHARGEETYAFERRALEAALDAVRRAGARPILLVPPALEARSTLVGLARDELGADVLVFNDPTRYPNLYDPEYRFDMGHLNARGAEMFTRLVAEEVAALARTRATRAE